MTDETTETDTPPPDTWAMWSPARPPAVHASGWPTHRARARNRRRNRIEKARARRHKTGQEHTQ